MKAEAIKAYRQTNLFSKERRTLVETLIQTGEALKELQTLPHNFSDKDINAKKAYCFQTAYVLSRTTAKKCSQNKRAKAEFQTVIENVRTSPIPKSTGIQISQSLMAA